MMKKFFTLCTLLFSTVVLMAQSGVTYNGSVSVMVGGTYGPYTNDTVTYVISQNEDASLNVTICEYMLLNTVMGDLTLGQYTVSNIAYDEARGGYYRDYTNDGLTMHFKAVSNGTAIMDKDYTFEQHGGNLLLTATETGYTIVNNFQPGSMPFPIVATANVTPATSAIRTISAESGKVNRYDLQGRRTRSHSGLMIEAGKVVLR